MTDAKVAIVTGGARGIGLAATEIFLDQGWRVAVVDRDAEELHRACGSLENVLPVEADISDPQSVDGVIRTVVAQWGRVDALVNNAGVALFRAPTAPASRNGAR